MTGGLPQSFTAGSAVSLGVATCVVDGLPAAATLELAQSCFGIRIIDLLRSYVGNEQSLRKNTSCWIIRIVTGISSRSWITNGSRGKCPALYGIKGISSDSCELNSEC
jgi:hypothetical protein